MDNLLLRLWNLCTKVCMRREYERVSTDQERSMCHVPGDVTNQQSLQPTGTHMDPAVLQLQVAKPLNYAVNMSTVPPQQMTPARPTFNMTSCTVNIYYAPVSFQASASQLTENYKLSHEDLERIFVIFSFRLYLLLLPFGFSFF